MQQQISKMAADINQHFDRRFKRALSVPPRGQVFTRACHRPYDRAAIAKVFAEVRRKKSISHIVRTPWHVREVENYALSKFQPPTTLGDPQNVDKTNQKKIDFFVSEISFSLIW